MKIVPEPMNGLETAEDFLEFFAIPHDKSRLAICRLHILQRFHDYADAAEVNGLDETGQIALYKSLLEKAYNDFTQSDPLTERVFKVLQDAKVEAEKPRAAFVSVSEILPVPGKPQK